MNEQEKREYLESYKKKKSGGELFWPDVIAKDAIASLMLFVLLLCLAIFAGVPNEPPANPSDAAYVPRPEWYFLWMFQLLKYFPGKLEGVAIVGLGALIVVGLFGLPFLDRGRFRHPLNRPVAAVVMSLIVAGIVFLTIQAVVTTPPQVEAVSLGADLESRIAAGQELYSVHCAECHGAEGEGAEITTSPGDYTQPLNSEDFLMTRTSDTIFQVISYGQPGLGMQAFGLANGGILTDQEIRAIVAFIESWNQPVDEGATAALAAIETPSFSVDVQPLLQKRCSSCHGRRTKGNFSVLDYTSVMESGDNAPVITPGDPANSTLVRMLHGEETDAGGLMPPSRALQDEEIKLIERWVDQGAQNN